MDLAVSMDLALALKRNLESRRTDHVGTNTKSR
jgi:hypothetical protein